MSTDVAGLVPKVNQVLLDGEPYNISVDEQNDYTGYKPQAVVDAMNEGMGLGNWGFEEICSTIETVQGKQGPSLLAVAQVKVWLKDVEFRPTSWGQNRVTRGDLGDARKGVQTDAIKKALSYFSIGNRAYHGLLEKNKKPGAQPAPRPVPPTRDLHDLTKPGSYEQHHRNDATVPSAPTVKELQARCNDLCGAGAWQTMVHKATKVPISDGPILDRDMTIDYRQKTAAYLEFVQEQKDAKGAA